MAARALWWPGAPRPSGDDATADETPAGSLGSAELPVRDEGEDQGARPLTSAPGRPERMRPAGASPADAGREVRVASVKRVRSIPGLYEITWRDGKRRRRAMTLIDDWVKADQVVCEAVAAAYPEHDRPAVNLPIQAWR